MVASDSVLKRYALAYIKNQVVTVMLKGFWNFVIRKTPQVGVRRILKMRMKNLHIQIQAIGTIQEAEIINITQGITGKLQALKLYMRIHEMKA
jgi:hypothetical protein